MIKFFIPRLLTILLIASVALACNPTAAQITTARILSASPDRTANLTEQLVNRLRAFDEEKRNYVAMVVKLVTDGKLDAKLVLAVQRYAITRNPEFPFPFFERALRYQAGKRGVVLPTVRQYASSKDSRF